MTLTRRLVKGSRLTNGEGDANVDHFDLKTSDGWRDNIVEIKVDSSSPNAPTLGVVRGNILAWQFAPNELTEAHSAFHVDHDYKVGTKLFLHVHWVNSSTTIGTVRWGFEYSVARGHQQAAFPAPTTVYVEQSTTGTAYMHMVGEVSDGDAVSGVTHNIEPDTIILCRIFRDGAHVNDTLDETVFGIFLDIHYQADRATTPNKAPNFYGV